MSINLYIGASFVCSLLAALAATPIVVHVARRCGFIDLPGARKVHQVATPRIGGLAVATACIFVVVPLFLAAALMTDQIVYERGRVATMLLSATFVLVVGLVDDIVNLSARQKLFALLLAAIGLCSSGAVLHEINISGNYAIPLGLMSWPVTILWVVAVTVSINFIDGLDGLAAGIAAITCGVLAIGAAVTWNVPVLMVSLALLGSLIGFLFYNFSPAKVFMGDCGSMFIGFTLASLGVLFAQKGTHAGGLLLPALALSVPFLDLLLTVVRRAVLQRRSLFSAERGHIHHRLLDIGLCQKHAVLLLYMATAGSATVAMMAFFHNQLIFFGALLLLVPALLFLFRAAGSVRGRETLAAVRRNRAIGREGRTNHRAFEEMQLRFRNVKSFGEWWEQLCSSAEMLGLVRVTLPLINRDGTPRTLRWCRSDPSFIDCETLKAALPVRHRRTGSPIDAEIEIAINTTLESAGQRVALFSRLMGEHSLAELETPTAFPGKHEPASRYRRSASAAAREKHNGESAVAAEVTAAAAAANRPPRIALVHDFLYTYAGAERVVEQILNCFPDAELFSLFDFLPPDQRAFIREKTVKTSFIQKLPFARAKHRAYLPLMPLAIEQLDVSEYDIIISSSYCVAKGVLTRPDQLHICYCHSPMRFAWDLQHQYLSESGLVKGLKSFLARIILHYARTWDARSANGVDLFVTNSDFVGRRVEKAYRRQSITVYPPVDIETFTPGNERSDFYVTVSRMVPYKRIDLIVEAFTAMPEKRLIVVGDGPEMEKIREKAGPNVKLVGHKSLDELRRYLQLAKAFVFAAEEDFGICVVEAQACGTPVIAFRRGGASETVLPGVTGTFFEDQTTQDIINAVEEFELTDDWDHERVRSNAERFSAARFRVEFAGLVNARWERFKVSRAQRGSQSSSSVEREMPAWALPIGVPDDELSPATGILPA